MRRKRTTRPLTNEVVIFPGQELQPPWLRGERSKSYGEIHELVRLVAYRDDSRVRIGYPASLVLLLGNVVDDVLFGVLVVCTRCIHWTDYVHLVILELHIPFVHVDYVIRVVNSKSETKRRETRQISRPTLDLKGGKLFLLGILIA